MIFGRFISGNGRNPGMRQLMEVGMEAGLEKKWLSCTAGEIEEIVNTELRDIMASYR